MATRKNKQTVVNVNDETQKPSELKSMLGNVKVITVNKGTKDEYKLTLQFPGVARASQMRDDCRDVFGNPRRTDFMQEAIKYLIVKPHIASLDWWNTHKGFDEATNKVMDYFYNAINGDVK